MQQTTKNKSSKTIYITAGVFSLVWIILTQAVGITESFDNKWSDVRLVFPRYMAEIYGRSDDYTFLFGKYINKPADPQITITAIDDHTVGKYGFPFKRKYYGQLIDKLNKLGVKSIGMDVMFFEPDKDDLSNDARFLSSVAKAGNVVNLFAINKETLSVKTPLPGLGSRSAYMAYPNSDISLDDDGHARRFYLFYPGLDENFDGVSEKTLNYGNLDLGKLRCSPYCDDVKVASLGMATYAVATSTPLYDYHKIYGSSPIMLNYRYPVFRQAHPGWEKPSGATIDSTFRQISVADIIEDTLAPEEKESLKGGITLVGSTALGTYDHFPAPFSTLFPGVEIHATCIDNIKHDDPLMDIGGGYLTLAILLLPWLAVYLRKFSIKVMVSVSAVTAAVLLVGDYALLCNQYTLPFIAMMLSFLIPSVYVIVDKGLSEGREKKWIKSTFGQYLSPKVVELITKDPSKLSLGGEKRDMTAFFLDLAGFTTMSEKLSPEELTAMLVEYLSAFTDVILKYDGTVDKYIGDCVVAFWNAPLDQADHRKLGVLAAIDCQKAMTRLNVSLTQFTIKPKCRVGVNSGPMVVGNMGSRSRLSYTVMGDSVNMASRMEGANKYFHSKIMTSEATFGDLKDLFDYRYLGSIRVVGKAIPTKVYEPFAPKGEAAPEEKTMLAHYAAGIEKFYKGDYAGSLPDFKAALAAAPGDGPSQFYIDNAEKFAKEPIKDWDQSFNLTEKG
ncbi:MAG: adenylate/guanylate cyclase domain-containing protein [Elusimicrobiota bacterium]|nr:adenylate/guanylate cyclase domain-containing protein [Elusimicrobiota bacterium]